MKIVIRQESDFWEQIFVNKELVAEAHVLSTRQVIEKTIDKMKEEGILTEKVEITFESWEDEF